MLVDPLPRLQECTHNVARPLLTRGRSLSRHLPPRGADEQLRGGIEQTLLLLVLLPLLLLLLLLPIKAHSGVGKSQSPSETRSRSPP